MNNITIKKDEAKYWITSSNNCGFSDIGQVTDFGEEVELFNNKADYLARIEELGIIIEEM